MDGGEDAAAVAIKSIGPTVVTDLAYHVAHHHRHVDVCLRVNLARHHHLPRGHEGFQGHMALRVAHQEFVQQRIADLVGDLVRVSL